MYSRFLKAALCLVGLSACTFTPNRGTSTAAPTITPAPTVVQATPAPAGLTVAWVEDSNLLSWQEGDASQSPRRIASGAVIRAYVAPDGRHVAYTRGPQGSPETLWVVDTLGTAEQELVPREKLVSYRDGAPIIGDVAWADGTVLYFNTFQELQTGTQPDNNLYRADTVSREVTELLPRDQGGAITISPDRQHIALVYPGAYGTQNGRVTVVDLLGRTIGSPLEFPAVSTASEYAFYPPVYWGPDSDSLRVPIPDRDLVTSETTAPPVQLWLLGLDGRQRIAGYAPASFFGLPEWDANAGHILYLQRAGANSNTFNLMVADADGQNPQTYASGETGAFQPPQWIPGVDRFIYVSGEPGQTWLGGAGVTALRLPNSDEVMFDPIFADSSTYVFASAPGDSFELRYARLANIGTPSTLIATVNSAAPVFDAAMG